MESTGLWLHGTETEKEKNNERRRKWALAEISIGLLIDWYTKKNFYRYVTLNGGTVFSPLMKLKPGDVIFGNMTQVSKDTWCKGDYCLARTFYAYFIFIFLVIASVADGYNTNVTVTHPRLASQPWAYNTLELYNIDSCTWMPPSGSACKFTNLLVSLTNVGLSNVSITVISSTSIFRQLVDTVCWNILILTITCS